MFIKKSKSHTEKAKPSKVSDNKKCQDSATSYKSFYILSHEGIGNPWTVLFAPTLYDTDHID